MIAVLLAPGAGAGRDQPSLVAIEWALDPVPVERMDFPYRIAGRRSPDRPPVLLAAVRAAAESLSARAGVPPERIVLGGRSMGGRMCSMAVAEGLPALALVLVSYPLHPPGRPDKMRTEHFPDLTLPCLFVSGTRDAFGSPAELEDAATAIPGPVTHVWIDGGDHGLRKGDQEVAAAVRSWLDGVRRGAAEGGRPRG
ncbi:MAG: dienelactone hydrolase [Actinobacteria bacterium]|nr:dienelactone hydrolase [Actinomycetota bacterium]